MQHADRRIFRLLKSQRHHPHQQYREAVYGVSVRPAPLNQNDKHASLFVLPMHPSGKAPQITTWSSLGYYITADHDMIITLSPKHSRSPHINNSLRSAPPNTGSKVR